MMKLFLTIFFVAVAIQEQNRASALVMEKNLLNIPRPSNSCWDIEWTSLEELVEGSVCVSQAEAGHPWDGPNPGTFNVDSLTCQTTFSQSSVDEHVSSGKVKLLLNSNIRSARPVWVDFKDSAPANAIVVGQTRRQRNVHIARVATKPRASNARYEVMTTNHIEYQDANSKKTERGNDFKLLTCQDIN